MTITLSAAKLRPWLFTPMALVILAGVAVELLQPIYHLPTDQGWVPMLSLSYEWNLPTVYTAAVISLCVLALGLIAASTRRQGGPFVKHWTALALGFGYIGLDELLGFHEMADRLVQLNHIVYFDWIIPASVVVLAVGAAYLPFLRRLPAPTRWRFVLAGAIYVGGAVGMEIPLGWWTSRHGAHGLGYGLIDAVEESLEMLGLNLFLLALLEHLARQGTSLAFAAGPPAAEPTAEASP